MAFFLFFFLLNSQANVDVSTPAHQAERVNSQHSQSLSFQNLSGTPYCLSILTSNNPKHSVFSSRLVWYLVFQPLRSTWSKSLSLPTIWVVASFSYLIIVSYRTFCCGGWLVCVKRDRWSIHSAETKLYIPHCIINCLCTNACSVCCQQLILSLWHCRLGHPSFSRIGH